MRCNKALPSGSSCLFNMRLARNGMTVKDTKSEAAIVKRTVTGNDLINWPDPSGRNSKGRKANIKVAVQPNTATAIWPVPLIAAETRSSPSRMRRAMFSVTTMESSTKSPSESTKPAIDNWFSVKPAFCNQNTPINSDIGMDSITTKPARMPSGNKVIRTRPKAMPKSR